MPLTDFANSDTWATIKTNIAAIRTAVNLLTAKINNFQSFLTSTAYIDSDTILSYTTPNDGITRIYNIYYSGFADSNGAALSGGVKLTIDSIDKVNQVAVDLGTTSVQNISIIWSESIGPNKVIAIKARLNNANKIGNNTLLIEEK